MADANRKTAQPGMKLRKFMFDYDFDAPPRPKGQELEELEEELEPEEPEEPEEVEPEEPEEPPEPTFTETEMMARIEEARAAAFEEGRRTGGEEAWAEAHAQIEQSVTKALTVVGQALQNLFGLADEKSEAAYHDSVAIAMAMARKLLPEMARRNALTEVESMVSEALTRLADQPKITVFVHDSVADGVSECLSPVIEGLGYEGRLILQVDDNMDPNDAAIEWSGGGSERDTTRIWLEIDKILRSYFGDQVMMDIPDDEQMQAIRDAHATEEDGMQGEELPEQAADGGSHEGFGDLAGEDDSFRRPGEDAYGDEDYDGNYSEGGNYGDDDAYLLPDEQ